jgi:hypothetical protein
MARLLRDVFAGGLTKAVDEIKNAGANLMLTVVGALEQFIAKHGIGVGLAVFLAYEFHQVLKALTDTIIFNQQKIVELVELVKQGYK